MREGLRRKEVVLSSVYHAKDANDQEDDRKPVEDFMRPHGAVAITKATRPKKTIPVRSSDRAYLYIDVFLDEVLT